MDVGGGMYIVANFSNAKHVKQVFVFLLEYLKLTHLEERRRYKKVLELAYASGRLDIRKFISGLGY